MRCSRWDRPRRGCRRRRRRGRPVTAVEPVAPVIGVGPAATRVQAVARAVPAPLLLSTVLTRVSVALHVVVVDGAGGADAGGEDEAGAGEGAGVAGPGAGGVPGGSIGLGEDVGAGVDGDGGDGSVAGRPVMPGWDHWRSASRRRYGGAAVVVGDGLDQGQRGGLVVVVDGAGGADAVGQHHRWPGDGCLLADDAGPGACGVAGGSIGLAEGVGPGRRPRRR